MTEADGRVPRDPSKEELFEQHRELVRTDFWDFLTEFPYPAGTNVEKSRFDWFRHFDQDLVSPETAAAEEDPRDILAAWEAQVYETYELTPPEEATGQPKDTEQADLSDSFLNEYLAVKYGPQLEGVDEAKALRQEFDAFKVREMAAQSHDELHVIAKAYTDFNAKVANRFKELNAERS